MESWRCPFRFRDGGRLWVYVSVLNFMLLTLFFRLHPLQGHHHREGLLPKAGGEEYPGEFAPNSSDCENGHSHSFYRERGAVS